MIVTVTPNAAVDKVLFVEDFGFGQTIRSVRSAWGVGGKGACASWIMGALGVPSLALGFAAGRTGERMQEMLRARGVQTDFVITRGETRVTAVVVCESEGSQSTITENTLSILPEHIAALDAKVREALSDASCLILGGSLPPQVSPDIYVQWMGLAHQRNILTILDASGDTLRQSVVGKPKVLKPNEDEIEQLLGYRPSTWEEIHTAGCQLLAQGIEIVVITRGEHGAMALQSDAAYLLHPISIPVVNTAGAGDAMIAGLAISLSQGKKLEQALRLAGAAAAAVCLTDATADCRQTDMERLMPEMQIERWNAP